MNNTKNLKWIVYMHINNINGKIYIGRTCKKAEYRWNNGKGYKSQPYFWNAIKKYGWENFEHKIIANDLNEAESCSLEIKLIAEYDSMNPSKGYNQTAGGEGMLGWHHTEYSRSKIIQSNKTRIISDETKKKQSYSHKGKYVGTNNPFYGKRHSEQTKKKISEANTGKTHLVSEETRNKISKSRIGKYSGENSPWFGKKHTEEQLAKISKASKYYQNLPDVKNLKSEKMKGNKNPMYGKIPTTAKAVCQYTKQGVYVNEYISATHAKRATGISNASIGACCKGQLKSAGGFIWKYKTEV